MKQKNIARRESAKGFVRGIETFVEVCALSVLYYAFWDIFYNAIIFNNCGRAFKSIYNYHTKAPFLKIIH